MSCIKTGFHGYVEAYNEYVYGDAFAFDGQIFGVRGFEDRSEKELELRLSIGQIGIQPVHVFRIVQRSFEPLQANLHFTIHNYGEWFDRGGSTPDSHKGCSTMIATNVTNHGYEGKEI